MLVWPYIVFLFHTCLLPALAASLYWKTFLTDDINSEWGWNMRLPNHTAYGDTIVHIAVTS